MSELRVLAGSVLSPVLAEENTAASEDPEVFHAVDNLSSTDDSLDTGNDYFIHVRWFYSRLAAIGYRGSTDTHYSGAKCNLARVVRVWFMLF